MKQYVVTLHGIEHTVLLNADDAKKLNAQPVEKPVDVKAAAPANKSRDASSPSSAAARMHTKG